ncbi:Spermidine synthase [Legionella massiliensis]|uniref:Spermidine synthase n=1 Tax=Legionella massiliensis TaxID=1034943 RepID=A0A078KXP8_9GAMM|nr:hypothetical protein [Legionella massiliensis]CDZ76493.1 Spermidine synthase [Legionella massiliensis]CEE12231.1 hypothetical protein BN1094_00762 [Legionella massiliensis]
MLTKDPDSCFTSLPVYILVGCLAAATMGIELVQTRILSFLYYNNIVYLTVTIALLGFGISGVLVSLFADKAKNKQLVLSLLTLGSVFSPLICLFFVSRIPEYFQSYNFNIGKLLSSYILLVIPFLFFGAALGWIFMHHAKSINRLYATDLVCSSLAVVAFVFLLYPLGADWFLWLCSAIVLFGFIFYSYTFFAKSWLWSISLIYLGALLLVNNSLLSNKPEAYKTLGDMEKKGGVQIEQTVWTPITRIDLATASSYPGDLLSFPPADIKVITQDATAPTPLLGPHFVNSLIRDIPKGKLLRAIALIYYLNKNPHKALVIGVGGGIDMLTAKLMGAEQVIGVEINPATFSLITGPYRNYVQWPNWSGVELVRAEGRNYIHAKSNYFDTIVMTGIDTFSALNSGAYVLSENYLYTVEAIKDYLKAIKPNGVVGIYRWLFPEPRETLRLASIYVKAAQELRIAHPEQSIMVVADNLGWLLWGATFFKKTAFSQAEVNQVLSLVAKEPSMAIIYLPKIYPKGLQEKIEEDLSSKFKQLNFARMAFNKVINATDEERNQFIGDYQFRIDPVYDNRPFFFEYHKDSFMQDLTVTKVRGPTILYILLINCLMICAISIFLPLAIFQSRGLKTPGVIPLILFFSCLGFGFMTLEIGAMQVVSAYIGDPMHSLSLILAGLLLSTGIGSAISTKFSGMPQRRMILFIMPAIALTIILWLVFINLVQPLTMDYSLVTRCCITLIGLIPLGILLGMPFPTVIREIEQHYPSFIAWAWGVNGITSVLASVIAIIIAINFGFYMTIIIAAITYLFGLGCYWQYRNAYYQRLSEN